MRIAFKEWAVVVDALGQGEQILVLRKGGISEQRGGFQAEHPEFLLFPTQFHQQRESVTPPAQARYDRLVQQWPSKEVVRLEYYAQVVERRLIESRSAAESLHGQHIWTESVIAGRFDWGHAQNIYALALRVYRLPLVIELPMLPNYGGCTSWVELEKDIPVADAQPVMDALSFDKKLQQVHSALSTA